MSASAALFLAGALSISVVDGDTLVLSGERIRIANIDAPELHRAQCDAERRLAKVARGRLAELLLLGKLKVKRGDPLDGRKRDRHGRTLATITVDGRDIGELMIAEGLARPWEGKRRTWCG
jgi:micrococcal nuclease